MRKDDLLVWMKGEEGRRYVHQTFHSPRNHSLDEGEEASGKESRARELTFFLPSLPSLAEQTRLSITRPPRPPSHHQRDFFFVFVVQ